MSLSRSRPEFGRVDFIDISRDRDLGSDVHDSDDTSDVWSLQPVDEQCKAAVGREQHRDHHVQ
jgi:hypothetical protein